MVLKIVKVCVKSGGIKLGFFIAEDIYNDKDIYIINKKSCEWFDAIHLGNVFETLASSDGLIQSVIDQSIDDVKMRMVDEEMENIE